MAKQLRSMNVGYRFTGNFYASNGVLDEARELEFITRDNCCDWATLRDVKDGHTFNVYKSNGHWAYGSSADRFTVARSK